jgi:hypothetical protein
MQHSDNGKVDLRSFLGTGAGLRRRFDTCLERTVLRVDPRRKQSDRPGPESPPNPLTKAPTLTPNAGATMNWLRTHTLIPAQFSTSWPSRSSTIFTLANYTRRHSERCRRQMMAPRSFDLPPRRDHFTFFCAFRLSAQYFFIR